MARFAKLLLWMQPKENQEIDYEGACFPKESYSEIQKNKREKNQEHWKRKNKDS